MRQSRTGKKRRKKEKEKRLPEDRVKCARKSKKEGNQGGCGSGTGLRRLPAWIEWAGVFRGKGSWERIPSFL